MIGYIDVARLTGLMERAPVGDATARARDLLSAMDPASELPVATQNAGSTAATLELKYTLASERGATVIGLEQLVPALRNLESMSAAAGCIVQGRGQFALVFLTEDRSELVGVLHVTSATVAASISGSHDG